MISSTAVQKSVLRLTLDSTFLFSAWRDQGDVENVSQLIELAEKGEVDLAVTARVREDIPHPPYVDRLNALDDLRIAMEPAVWRLGVSRLGEAMLADGDFDGRYDEAVQLASSQLEKLRSKSLCKGSKPPNERDWDHLHSHLLLGRDAFVTGDCGILVISEWLLDEFGIVVFNAGRAVEAAGSSEQNLAEV